MLKFRLVEIPGNKRIALEVCDGRERWSIGSIGEDGFFLAAALPDSLGIAVTSRGVIKVIKEEL